MPIAALHVENFKGLRDRQRIELKPITIFIGPNSSGKSSCIHALACLAQTLKLSNDTRPLILDDEFAYVHLGRYVEVSHSRSYSDAITLGIDFGPVSYTVMDGKGASEEESSFASGIYSFKSTKRTQDVFLNTAKMQLGNLTYEAKKVGASYDVINMSDGRKSKFARESGFILDWRLSATGMDFFRSFFPMFGFQNAITSALRNTLYLGPFRQSPLRRYPTRGSNPVEVGAQGEAAITLLANEMVQSQTRTHIKKISEWLDLMGLGTRLDVSRVATSDLFDVTIQLTDGTALPIADLGYGLSQVLPVLTQCSFAPAGSTLLFEQPELHLHPLAARPLAKIFIETVKERGVQIIAEIHTPDLFGQLLTELRMGTISLDDLALYRVSREEGCSVVHAVDIDPETFDVYEQWERGFSRQ